MAEDERIDYSPEKEIRTVLCVLVIRNQALERNYRGGLWGFPKKYGGRYNDEITTLPSNIPEYDPVLIDLRASGLEPKRDFITFYDGDFGLPAHALNFKHFPFEADGWLGGYYHNCGVVVFMRS